MCSFAFALWPLLTLVSEDQHALVRVSRETPGCLFFFEHLLRIPGSPRKFSSTMSHIIGAQ